MQEWREIIPQYARKNLDAEFWAARKIAYTIFRRLVVGILAISVFYWNTKVGALSLTTYSWRVWIRVQIHGDQFSTRRNSHMIAFNQKFPPFRSETWVNSESIALDSILDENLTTMEAPVICPASALLWCLIWNKQRS